MRVLFDRQLRKSFEKVCKEFFPKEFFVYLLLNKTNKGYTVKDILWPEENEIYQEPNGYFVLVSHRFYSRALKESKKNNCLLGDLHSHCHLIEMPSDPSPSYQDFARFRGKRDKHPLKIFGICELRKSLKNNRVYTKTNFWRAEAPLEVK